MFWVPFLLVSSALTASPVPIQLHPANPHYFLFRGKPTVLVTSGEHYGAVLNLDFDFHAYLDELARCEFNLTRTFSGTYREVLGSFRIRDNTLAPRAGRYSCPWAEQGGKFDLDRLDEAYFRRLREFLTEASRRGIVVEYVLFCPLYEDNLWDASPMNAKNNVNGVGRVPRTEVLTLKHPELVQRQLAFVRRAVTELNPFDNVYFEICNEPYFAGVTLDWQWRVASEIVATESALSDKHLIAQNIANEKARVDDPTPGVSIFNFHYASPPVTVNMNRHLNKPIAFDETGFKGTGDRVYRRQAWEFMLAGGAVFSNLDYSFTPEHEDGTAKVDDPTPGGGGRSLRRQLGVLKRFLERLDLIEMTPDGTGVRLVAPQGHDRAQVWSLADRKHEVFAVYAPSGPTVTLKLDGVEGACRITWIDPRDGTTLESRDVDAGRGTALQVTSPPFAEDAVLLVTHQTPKP
jgi:hypothetical protein